ncbi:hypothetical protein VM1G_02944 [Cytospora mali]|uniref:Rhodopsin domain-containing protein n=1 Tax=Cytospora mali TaxID=578113 RepID=A0A194VT98_CYTMA|nr:hypothetical protein VM1G_02944 [Valsa mali]
MATPTSTSSEPSMVTSALLAVSIVFPILGTIAVGLRFLVHNRVKKQKPSSDDWVCALAQLAAWGISIDTFVAAGMAGTDYTYPSLSPLSASVIFLRTLWIEGFPLVISLSLVKISILLFYARVFTTFKFKLAVHIYVGILTAWCISMVICQLLAANPIQNAWNPLATTPLRFNYNAWSLAFAGMSMVFDVIVLCFPLPIIYKLQMTQTRKLQVVAIFWLGIFCCVSSAVRFYYLYSEIYGATALTGPDRYMKTSTAFIWGTVEPNASIIAACLPCYAPFFTKGQGLPSLFAKFGSFFSSGRGNKAKATESSDDTFPLGSDGSYQLREPKNRPWERVDGGYSSHNVDIERGNGWNSDREPLKHVPFQVKVTKDFTASETREY